jgi:hypothetical protein
LKIHQLEDPSTAITKNCEQIQNAKQAQASQQFIKRKWWDDLQPNIPSACQV